MQLARRKLLFAFAPAVGSSDADVRRRLAASAARISGAELASVAMVAAMFAARAASLPASCASARCRERPRGGPKIKAA